MKQIFTTLILALLTVLCHAQAKPKNVILMIGDGMGVQHVAALNYLQQGHSSISQFPFEGRSMTYSATDTITDSAAGGSALSTGVKTPNGHVAVNADGTPNETLVEWAEKRDMATGIVVTSSITDATPADFYAHVTSRKQEEEIARQLVYTNADFVVGGCRHFFEASKRKDGLNLIDSLIDRNYQMVYTLDDLKAAPLAATVALLSDEKPDRSDVRGPWLDVAVEKALQVLERYEEGFFLMVEGSQIDWACHVNDFAYMQGEILEFDRAVAIARAYAEQHPETLVVVTADHETGGLAIGEEVEKFSPKAAAKKVGKHVSWKTDYHTGADVGVFAFGPGAEQFQGRMENTDISQKIKKLLEK